ncbi:hypothetical protein QBC35DRAFT_472753 [Podospora australis]|uniref:Uncharacterized protein n=1 Tax=Podospora australis TaxID=1536484 RepID=A0AAN6WY04_9PEZI|nr:hypothetical protein QBC35DRAFT_472753 [Podospora australis]
MVIFACSHTGYASIDRCPFLFNGCFGPNGSHFVVDLPRVCDDCKSRWSDPNPEERARDASLRIGLLQKQQPEKATSQKRPRVVMITPAEEEEEMVPRRKKRKTTKTYGVDEEGVLTPPESTAGSEISGTKEKGRGRGREVGDIPTPPGSTAGSEVVGAKEKEVCDVPTPPMSTAGSEIGVAKGAHDVLTPPESSAGSETVGLRAV